MKHTLRISNLIDAIGTCDCGLEFRVTKEALRMAIESEHEKHVRQMEVINREKGGDE